MEQIVKQMSGIVQEKEEKLNKKGAKYIKFTIDGHKYSCWDYEMGIEINVGSTVQVVYKETESVYNGNPTIFRNVESIVESVSMSSDTDKQDTLDNGVTMPVKKEETQITQKPAFKPKINPDYKAMEADKFSFGMAFNNACGIIAESYALASLNKGASFDDNWCDALKEITKKLYKAQKEVRMEIEGY